MKCDEWKDKFDTLDALGGLDGSLKDHIVECEACRAYYNLTLKLRSLSVAEERDPNLWSTFQERLYHTHSSFWKHIVIPTGLAFSLVFGVFFSFYSGRNDHANVLSSFTSVDAVYQLASGKKENEMSSLDYYYKILK